MKLRLRETYAGLDPVRLLRDIREVQSRLVTLTDGVPAAVARPDLEGFLESLKTIWKQGDVRPTSAPKPKQQRERRRPDPLIAVTAHLRDWFEQEPWRTGRELLDRLQAERPGEYPDALLRTVQRRLKIWRSEQAHGMSFGAAAQSTIITSEIAD